MGALTYSKAGVDIRKAEKLVKEIAGLSRQTRNSRVKSSIGGYASLYALDSKRWLAASTDGVGTKLKLAFLLNRHHTVGIDLVAMSVNDLICAGAEPLFFLDYLATGRLKLGVAKKVLEGVSEGCLQARSALVGGETAEMPDMYAPGEYDLAGFAVGFLDPKSLLPRKDLRVGDALIGVGSSGCHSNGYSLLRKLLPKSGPDRKRIASRLLEPTKIYVQSVLPLVKQGWVKGMAHITGGGFKNVPRISPRFSYELDLPKETELPKVYRWVRDASQLSAVELGSTFNMGLGMILAVDPKDKAKVLRRLRSKGEKAWEVGQVVRKRPKQGPQVFYTDSNVDTSTHCLEVK